MLHRGRQHRGVGGEGDKGVLGYWRSGGADQQGGVWPKQHPCECGLYQRPRLIE